MKLPIMLFSLAMCSTLFAAVEDWAAVKRKFDFSKIPSADLLASITSSVETGEKRLACKSVNPQGDIGEFEIKLSKPTFAEEGAILSYPDYPEFITNGTFLQRSEINGSVLGIKQFPAEYNKNFSNKSYPFKVAFAMRVDSSNNLVIERSRTIAYHLHQFCLFTERAHQKGLSAYNTNSKPVFAESLYEMAAGMKYCSNCSQSDFTTHMLGATVLDLATYLNSTEFSWAMDNLFIANYDYTTERAIGFGILAQDRVSNNHKKIVWNDYLNLENYYFANEYWVCNLDNQ